MRTNLMLLLSIIFLMGCASSSMMPWGIEKARNNLMKIDLGMTKQDVINVMGMPYKREVYALPGGQLEYLIYITQYTYAGAIPDSDTTPICLENGKVTGWGRNFYEQQQQRYQLEVIHK